MTEKSRLTSARQKLKTSPMFKMVIIGIITLLLLIPAAMIQSIIQERETMSRSAILEVSDKWAQSQHVNGPILTIPYTKTYVVDEKVMETSHLFHMLPEELDLDGSVTPKQLKRSIYDIVVYNTDLKLSGSFAIKEIKKLTDVHELKWDEAFVTIGISDLRGIKNQLSLLWNNASLDVEPGSKISSVISSGITISTPLSEDDRDIEIPFSMDINLNGSGNLSFVPIGGVTKVKLTSPWPTPSFNGHILPDNREITDQGFTAEWKTLELNRNFPNSWSNNEVTHELANASFGVDLLLPIDDYQKSMRTAKYAILTLTLTFLVFFLVEVMNNKRIHPFQYILVGLALCLFYILLVSITEHSNFDFAYLVSAVSVILMIGLYSLSVFSNRKLSLTLVLILAALYGFLFVTLQLADYALLMGSIGLALILTATMYFTRKIDWYYLSDKVSAPAIG